MNKNKVTATPFGFRCSSCGCGVHETHVPDSVECDENYEMKMESQRG